MQAFAFLSGGFKPLHIFIKNIKLYTNDNGLLKHIEIWNKVESLFNEKLNKKWFYSRTKISSYNEKICDFKKLTKDEYCGQSILLLDLGNEIIIIIIIICEVKNKHYSQIFLDRFLECNNNKKKLV